MTQWRTSRGHSRTALSVTRLVTALTLLTTGSVIAVTQGTADAQAQSAAWTPTQAAMPADAGSNPDPYFFSVSCGAAASCAAVGDYYDAASNEHWLIETLSNGAWSATEPPLPANAATYPFAAFTSVSCSGPGFCAAVGTFRNNSNEIQGLIETLSNGVWSLAETPPPANAVAPDPRITFSSVSCSSASSCTAVGSYLSTSDYGSIQGLIETLSNGVWTPTEAPLPGNAANSPLAHLQRVSCAEAGSCVAAGEYYDTSFGTQGVIETLSNGVWTPTEAPLPGNAASNPSADLWSVSCGGTASCVAVGGYEDTNGQTHGVIETLSDGTWTAAEPSLPSDATSAAFADMFSVWCDVSGSCAAVGIYGATSGQQALIETLSGGAWHAAAAPLPANAGSSPFAGLSAISCAGTGSCAAVGGYTDTNGNRQGVIEGGSIAATPTLTVSVKVANAPMPVDPTTTANVTIVATVANDGVPAAGATVVASGPSPIQVTGTTGSNGQVSLTYPVDIAAGSAKVVATLGNESADVKITPYSSNVAGACQYDGSPNQLNSLSSVLDFLIPEAEVSQYLEYFSSFVSAIGTGTDFLPSKTQTDVYGYEISGPTIETIYALDVEVLNAKTGNSITSDVLYSHQSGLIQVTLGTGGGTPLQQIATRLSCGPIA